jgi:hypothetical protein
LPVDRNDVPLTDPVKADSYAARPWSASPIAGAAAVVPLMLKAYAEFTVI